MKRLNKVISLILLIATLFTVPVFAAPDSAADNWASIDTFTGSDTNATGGDNNNGYKAITTGTIGKRITNSKKYYAFTIFDKEDGVLGVKIGVGNVLNGLANTIFAIAKMWMEFVAKMTYWTLNLNLYQLGQNSIDSLIQSISKLAGNVYGGETGLSAIIWLGVALSFALVVLLFARSQTSGAFGKLLAILVVLVLLSSYAQLPKFFMGGIQTTVQSAGASILKTSGDNAKETAASRIWIMGVDIPWQQLEFGSVHVKASEGGIFSITDEKNKEMKWLSTYPENREDQFSDDGMPTGAQENALNSAAVQAQRAGEAFFVLLIDIVVGLIFLLLAAIALGFQIGSIIMWVMGFFVLIVALFPTHAMSKIKEWLGILAMTYFGQLVVYVGILLVLEIMTWFYKVGSDMFITFGLMVGMGVGIKFMSGPIIRLFSGSGSMAEAGGGAILQGLSGVRNRIGGGYKGSSTERTMYNPIRQNREAKRQVQKEAKMQHYQEKAEAKRARRENSASRVARDNITGNTQLEKQLAAERRQEKARYASDVREYGRAQAREMAETRRTERAESYRERMTNPSTYNTPTERATPQQSQPLHNRNSGNSGKNAFSDFSVREQTNTQTPQTTSAGREAKVKQSAVSQKAAAKIATEPPRRTNKKMKKQ